MGECVWGPSGWSPTVASPLLWVPLIRLTRQLAWLFSAATERDPEMMNCVGRRDSCEALARTLGRTHHA